MSKVTRALATLVAATVLSAGALAPSAGMFVAPHPSSQSRRSPRPFVAGLWRNLFPNRPVNGEA